MTGNSRRLSPGQVDTVLAAATTGAGWAFDALYHHFASSVVGYLRAQGAWDPEDLSSEVFLAVFKGIGSFDGDAAQLRTWLFSIAHHRVIDDRRRRSRRVVEVPQDHPAQREAASDTESEAIAILEAQRIARLAGRLPEDQRDVILMRLVGDLSVHETAEALGKTEGAVKALQRRGIQGLKNVLVQEISVEAVS